MYVDTIGQSNFDESNYVPADHEELINFDTEFASSDSKVEESYENLSRDVKSSSNEENKQEENVLAEFKEISSSESSPISELKDELKTEDKVAELQAALRDLNHKSSEKVEELSEVNEELYKQISLLNDLRIQNELSLQEMAWQIEMEAEHKSKVQEDLKNMQEIINELSKEITNFKYASKNAPEMSENDAFELQFQLAQIENEKLILQANLAAKELEIANLNERIGDVEVHKSLLDKQMERRKHEYEINEQNFQDERQRLQQALSTSRSQLAQINSQHRVDIEELESLHNLIEENDIKISILSQSKSKADIELKKAIFDKEQAEEENEELIQKFKYSESARRSLEEEVHKLKMRILDESNQELVKELENQLRLTENENNRIQNLLIESKKENQEIKKILNEIEANLKSEREQFKFTLTDMEKNHQKVAEESKDRMIKEISERIMIADELNLRLQDSEFENNNLKEIIIGKVVDNSTLENKIINFEHDMCALTLNNELLNSKLVENEKELSLSRQMLDELTKKCDYLLKINEGLDYKVEEFNTLTYKQLNQIEVLEAQLSNIDNEKRELIDKYELIKLTVENELIKKDAFIANLLSENNELNAQINEKSEQIQYILQQLEDLNSEKLDIFEKSALEIDNLNMTIKELINRNQDLIVSEKLSNDKITDIMDNLNFNGATIIDLNEKIRYLEEHNNNIAIKMKDIEKYSAIQEENHTNNIELKNEKLKLIENKLDKTTIENSDLIIKIDQLNQVNIDLNNNFSLLQQTANEKEEEIKSLVESMSQKENDYSQKIETLELMIKNTASANSEFIEDRITSINNSNEDLKLENKNLCETVVKLNEVINNLINENHASEHRSKELSLMIENLTKENNHLNQEIEEINLKNMHNQDINKDQEHTLSSYIEKLSLKDQEIKTKSQEINSLQEINREYELEIKCLTNKSYAQTETIDEPNSEYLRDQIDNLNKEVEELYEKMWKNQQEATANLEKQKQHYEKLMEQTRYVSNENFENIQITSNRDHIEVSNVIPELIENTVNIINEKSDEELKDQGWFTSVLSSIFLTDRERSR